MFLVKIHQSSKLMLYPTDIKRDEVLSKTLKFGTVLSSFSSMVAFLFLLLMKMDWDICKWFLAFYHLLSLVCIGMCVCVCLVWYVSVFAKFTPPYFELPSQTVISKWTGWLPSTGLVQCDVNVCTICSTFALTLSFISFSGAQSRGLWYS